jgi:SPP1 gp7 family putative phage head morphogenesis protein
MEGILKGRTEDELKRQAGILGKTVLNNARKADAIVNGSFHSGTFSDRIWQYQDLMRQDLGKLLQQGLIQGKGARAIAKDLKKYWYGADPKTGGGATYCMERLMRTELARVQTEAQKQTYKQNGVDYYIFIANKNPSKHGTCSLCRHLSSVEKFAVEDMMPGENAPPVHPHCRCSTAPYVNRKELDEILDYVEQGGTYEDWKRQNAQTSAKALENSKNQIYNASETDIERLSLRFLSNRDRTYKNLQNVPTLDGYEDIACHADPHEFGFVDPKTDETVQKVGAKFLANRVRDSGKYNGGPIRLIACESGKLDDGIAQQFANEMGVTVLAPSKIVYTNSQGFMVLADDDFEAIKLLRNAKEKWNSEGWRTFKPKGG